MEILGATGPLPTLSSADDKNIKRLLRKQGVDICRDQIYESTLNLSLDKFDYGFAFMIQKAHFGRSSLKIEDRYRINGFVLMEGLGEYELRVHLICVDSNHKGLGNILMQQVIQFADENSYSKVTLYSLPSPSLVDWYQQFGFTVIDRVIKNGEIKVYLMSLSI
jgi:ribosomal protein S18 acetylase RimI-like enzyme